MKTILVPTDFSENSENALHYAMEMNRKWKAKIILFHAYVIPVYATDLPFAVPENEEIEQESKAELLKLKSRFEGLYADADPLIEIATEGGSAEDEISTVAKNKNADLIIMGTQGASGLKEALVGTITAAVIKHADCPVVAVPDNAVYRDLKRIVFATNYAENDFENIEEIIEFGRKFNSEIILLHVSTGVLDRTFEFNSIEHFKERMKEESKYQKITFKLLESKDVLESLNNFLHENNVDLVAMTTRRRSFFQKLFGKSITRKMVYHTNIPLMAFHEKA